VAHESGSFRYNTENLNYSAKALRSVFGKYFPSDELANAYARKPEKIANRVYGNRMGNGTEESGDGWKYRGRGLIQLTGHDNYRRCGEGIGLNLEEEPDQVADNPAISVKAVGWFWKTNNLNQYADADDIKIITKRINGGYHGLEDRMEFLERARSVLC
jgi:putative chitinase